jgi:hypothetical protein
MTTGLLDNPEYWRTRAEEARKIAESLHDPNSREMMLGFAKDYERIAAQVEDKKQLRG